VYLVSYFFNFSFPSIFAACFFILLGIVYFFIKRVKRMQREEKGDSGKNHLIYLDFFKEVQSSVLNQGHLSCHAGWGRD